MANTEEELLRAAALENVKATLAARQRAEQALEQRTQELARSLSLSVVNLRTVLVVDGGDSEELAEWRTNVYRGRTVGPRIVMAGPILESARNIERMRKDPPAARVEPFERRASPWVC